MLCWSKRVASSTVSVPILLPSSAGIACFFFLAKEHADLRMSGEGRVLLEGPGSITYRHGKACITSTAETREGTSSPASSRRSTTSSSVPQSWLNDKKKKITLPVAQLPQRALAADHTSSAMRSKRHQLKTSRTFAKALLKYHSPKAGISIFLHVVISSQTRSCLEPQMMFEIQVNMYV